MKQLTQKEVTKHLIRINTWVLNKKGTEISKTFSTNSFVDGLALIARITVHAELMNHHPKIELTYGAVTVTLTTHDVKGLTKLDFELAKRIDAVQSSSN
jgi:4a-hydroxytetrahydrobiopterin dehydratase